MENPSTWAQDRPEILWNRSWRIFSTVHLDTHPAIRLAMTLVSQAATEQNSMMPPQRKINPMLRVGMTLSIIYARHQGISKSIMAPINLMVMPPVIFHT